ncbi:carboxymuconolactone decarboxylase family protein [Rhizobium sp. CG5]|uniref:carboxymuconolactone decarboxylase family protein n=1 Tax=Rhizobium sp. CG5 TaxID=2726076 RepID=UPI0020332F96|nr:carboxymuconolactone decarboxylase family protein [Rhizobium sp. CG5]
MLTSAGAPLDPDWVRAEFKRRRGHWHDDWEAMLSYSPAYVAAYLDFSAYSSEHGTIPPKLRELIYVATNCSPTHMFEKGFKNHARQALELGATPAELLSVVATVSAIGIHSYLLVAAAVEEFAPGQVVADAGHVEKVRKDHLAVFGAVLDEVNAGIALDPRFYACWLDFAAAPTRGPHAALSLKEAHLIALAVHAQVTQLNGTGVRHHVRAALEHGASAQEVLDVCRQISSMGIHAMVFALPIINSLKQGGV